jgi:hypothetical protein
MSLSFLQVLQRGNTIHLATPTNPLHPPPKGISFQGGFHGIGTNVQYAGDVNVSLKYNAASLPPRRESKLQMFHLSSEATQWAKVISSVDTAQKLVTARVLHLSWFALGLETQEVLPVGLELPLAHLAPEGQSVPVSNKAFKLGRTLPLRLQLFSLEGLLLTDAETAIPPKIVKLERSGNALNLWETDLDAGEANDSGLYFRFEDGYWVYNLTTKGLTSGTYTMTLGMENERNYVTGFVLK